MEVRGWPLDKYEKRELTAILGKLKLLPDAGQIIIHINEGKVSAAQPNFTIR